MTTHSTARKLFDLSGRKGVIYGGAGKMGRRFASTLLSQGARLTLVDISAEVETVASNLGEEYPGRIDARAFDVAQPEQGGDWPRENGEPFDFVIYNVMAKPPGYYRPTEVYPSDTWRGVVDGNLSGAFYALQKLVPLMRDGGSIVLTSSTYGVVAPDQRIYDGQPPASNPYGGSDKLNTPAAYSASKAGLIGLANYFASLLGPRQIRVNTLVPGGVFDGQDETFRTAYESRVPLGRMADWSDYDGAILFLVSDASRYMTGSKLVVDGGWTAW